MNVSSQLLSESKPVYAYGDYRKFLRDHMAQKKRVNPAFSCAVWARLLKLKSASTLIMILNGQRQPGPKLINSLASYFKFSVDEKKFFSDLVKFNKIQDQVGENIDLLSQVQQRHPQLKFKVLEFHAIQALSQWYYSAIREMVGLEGFRPDPKWIAAHFNYSIDESKIKLALESLLSLGLIVKDSDGKLTNSNEALDTPDNLTSEAIKTFHEQTLENAKSALRQVDIKDREISGVTIPVTSKSMSEAKKMIRDFQVKFIKECEYASGDQIYHLEVAYFPLTKKIQKGNKS